MVFILSSLDMTRFSSIPSSPRSSGVTIGSNELALPSYLLPLILSLLLPLPPLPPLPTRPMPLKAGVRGLPLKAGVRGLTLQSFESDSELERESRWVKVKFL